MTPPQHPRGLAAGCKKARRPWSSAALAALVLPCGCGGEPPAVAPAFAAPAAAAASASSLLPVASSTPAADAASPPLRASSVVPASRIRADVDLLERVLGALHPGLARYNTAAQLREGYDELQRFAASDHTLAEVFLALTAFTARLKCGHTYPNYFNQSAAVTAALFEGPRLPFRFRWMGGAMVVTGLLGEGVPLAAGDAIVALDGVPTERVLAGLLPYARADGGNDDKRRELLGVSAQAPYEAFDILWPLLFPATHPEGAAVVALRGGRAVTVRLQSYAERVAHLVEAPTLTGTTPLWSLRMLDGGVGYLRMPTWVTYKTQWDWKADLHAAAGRLAREKARGLIVDLRGNEGGLDVGDELLRHFLAAPLPKAGLLRVVRYRAVPAELRPHLDTWDRSFFDWGDRAKERSDGSFVLDGDDEGNGALTPAAPHLRVPLVVLIDAANSSATFQFAARVRRHRLGLLVGEPTGGNQRGINGGAFFFLRLPGTGLEVDVPLIGRFVRPGAPEPPDGGLAPDVLVPTTAESLARGEDPQLDAALARLRGRPR